MHFLFGRFVRLEKEARLIGKGLNPEFQKAMENAENDKKSKANAQEMRTAILNALRDNGEFDAKTESDQLWNSLQKFILELPFLQKQSMEEVNALLADVRKEFPKNTNELAELAIYLNLLTPGELVAVSREGGTKSTAGRPTENKTTPPVTQEAAKPTVPSQQPSSPETVVKKPKETKASLEAKVRSSRADIDAYNSKRCAILEGYSTQKYKSPAERQKSYKEACAKIQDLRKRMGDPVANYWENRNQWEAKSKQSWSRKLAAEQGRDVLASPAKKEQARIIKLIDKEGVMTFAEKEQQIKDDENGRILKNRDSVGSKIEGLSGKKGQLKKKYLSDAISKVTVPDISESTKKSASLGKTLARIDRDKNYGAVEAIKESIAFWEETVAPYTGKPGRIKEVKLKEKFAEIDLGSKDGVCEGQILHYLRDFNGEPHYGGHAKVTKVTEDAALVRFDRRPPIVGAVIGRDPSLP